MKRILFASGAIALLFSSACAPAAPTFDAAQIQASAVAAASTMVAMTQAAIPTATEVPPTPVPSPTSLPTLGPLPTLSSDIPTVAPTQNTADSCNHLLDLKAVTGKRAKLLIKNNTKGSVTLTMGYSKKDVFGQCGYMSFIIPATSSITESVPQTGNGPCYWVYAWVNDPKQARTLAPSSMYCMNNPDKWTMNITYTNITVTPP
jgi:hypothetical protein